MFCSNCGTENKEKAKFCGKCGAPLSHGKKAHTDVVVNEAATEKKSGSGKKLIIGGCIVVVVIAAIALLMRGGYNSDTPCQWCDETPTKSVEGFYYCEDCASNCWFCYEPATKHFVNELEELTFVCDDCYEEEFEYE